MSSLFQDLPFQEFTLTPAMLAHLQTVVQPGDAVSVSGDGSCDVCDGPVDASGETVCLDCADLLATL